jgi:hypothetical protein
MYCGFLIIANPKTKVKESQRGVAKKFAVLGARGRGYKKTGLKPAG